MGKSTAYLPGPARPGFHATPGAGRREEGGERACKHVVYGRTACYVNGWSLNLSCALVPVQVVFTCGAMGAGKSHVLGCACTQPSAQPDTDCWHPPQQPPCVQKCSLYVCTLRARAFGLAMCACVLVFGYSMDEANGRVAARELGARRPRSIEDPPSRVAEPRLPEVFCPCSSAMRARACNPKSTLNPERICRAAYSGRMSSD